MARASTRSPGPKRKPTPAKKLAKTHEKSRDNATAPTPVAGRPVPPAGLTKEELGFFETICSRLDGEKRLAISHTETITLTAQRLEQIRQLRANIKKNGYTYETTTDRSESPIIRKNPAAEILHSAMTALHSLVAELGLTPASVSKVGGGGKDAGPANPFKDFQ